MRFAKAQEKKMGKPEQPVVVKRGPQKSPISKVWISEFTPYARELHIVRGRQETRK